MAKKKKKRSKNDPAAPKAEIDAVKGFIVVMFVLIIALAVFIIITRGQLEEFDTSIARSKNRSRNIGNTSMDVLSYLQLIKGSEDTLLMTAPENFFKRIYLARDVGIPEKSIRLDPVKKDYDRRAKYTTISWDLDIENIDRKQAALLLHGVELNSPKARVIELYLRRNTGKDVPEDSWDGNFRVGYRVAGDASKN